MNCTISLTTTRHTPSLMWQYNVIQVLHPQPTLLRSVPSTSYPVKINFVSFSGYIWKIPSTIFVSLRRRCPRVNGKGAWQFAIGVRRWRRRRIRSSNWRFVKSTKSSSSAAAAAVSKWFVCFFTSRAICQLHAMMREQPSNLRWWWV